MYNNDKQTNIYDIFSSVKLCRVKVGEKNLNKNRILRIFFQKGALLEFLG